MTTRGRATWDTCRLATQAAEEARIFQNAADATRCRRTVLLGVEEHWDVCRATETIETIYFLCKWLVFIWSIDLRRAPRCLCVRCSTVGVGHGTCSHPDECGRRCVARAHTRGEPRAQSPPSTRTARAQRADDGAPEPRQTRGIRGPHRQGHSVTRDNPNTRRGLGH
jgi:hypothetical protein